MTLSIRDFLNVSDWMEHDVILVNLLPLEIRDYLNGAYIKVSPNTVVAQSNFSSVVFRQKFERLLPYIQLQQSNHSNSVVTNLYPLKRKHTISFFKDEQNNSSVQVKQKGSITFFCQMVAGNSFSNLTAYFFTAPENAHYFWL